MSENKFLSYIVSEGTIITVLGLILLILPKISSVSFGFTISLSLIFYGLYKMIVSFMTKNIISYYVLDIFTGFTLFLAGLILFFAPIFDIMVIIGLIGVYFILKSISVTSFGIQVRKILNFWRLTLLNGILSLFFGIITIILIPSGAIWLVGILLGIDFILSGFALINMYTATKYSQM